MVSGHWHAMTCFSSGSFLPHTLADAFLESGNREYLFYRLTFVNYHIADQIQFSSSF